MRRILLVLTVAGRRLAADGVLFVGSRYARRVLVLSATLTAAMLVGLLGYATSARADVTCSGSYCIEKTASADQVKVGEPLTFTIRGSCTELDCSQYSPSVRDTLPAAAGLEFVSASATGLGDPTCTFSERAGTVTCTPFSYELEAPFEATIEVIPRECGTFTNTATDVFFGESASETFTVVQCAPPTKEECKNGGWSNPALGFPDQGTCVSAVNRENR